MSIFNSLGSNYDLGFVIRSLSKGAKSDILKLEELLEERYGGKAILTYKGREALRLALRIISSSSEQSESRSFTNNSSRQARTINKPTVGVCGFTCIAVYDAIKEEGYNAHFLDLPIGKADIEKNELNFTADTLKNAVDKNPELRIVIVQNTLGFPCEIEKIAKFCRERKIILIEDLAHSIGSKYKNGQEAGMVGDFTILSFSQDKMIDGVSGGAVIVQNSKFSIRQAQDKKIQNSVVNDISLKQQLKDRLYPLFTYKIRNTYGMGVGKVLHALLKKTNLLSKPVDSEESEIIHKLPEWYCRIIYDEFSVIDKNLEHRRQIAKIYNQNLSKKILSENIGLLIETSSNLRFPIFVENRKDLINYLKKDNIFISDIWYDSPISPKRKIQNTSYQKGDCPNSENASENILNLPTHKNVSEKTAEFISKKINIWLTLQ